MRDTTNRSPSFWVCSAKPTSQETHQIDKYQSKMSALPSFLGFPPRCTPEQQEAINRLYQAMHSASEQHQADDPTHQGKDDATQTTALNL